MEGVEFVPLRSPVNLAQVDRVDRPKNEVDCNENNLGQEALAAEHVTLSQKEDASLLRNDGNQYAVSANDNANEMGAKAVKKKVKWKMPKKNTKAKQRLDPMTPIVARLMDV